MNARLLLRIIRSLLDAIYLKALKLDPPPLTCSRNILPSYTLPACLPALQQAQKLLKIPKPNFQLWHTTQNFSSPRLWPLSEKPPSAWGPSSKFIELWNSSAREPITLFHYEQENVFSTLFSPLCFRAECAKIVIVLPNILKLVKQRHHSTSAFNGVCTA